MLEGQAAAAASNGRPKSYVVSMALSQLPRPCCCTLLQLPTPSELVLADLEGAVKLYLGQILAFSEA